MRFKLLKTCYQPLKYVNAGAQPGGHFLPPKFLKHCIAILTFVETFKE